MKTQSMWVRALAAQALVEGTEFDLTQVLEAMVPRIRWRRGFGLIGISSPNGPSLACW